MLQDLLVMPATKSKREVRSLGAMERLFWLMDQKHPAHLTVTAEVKGFTKVQDWRDALDAVQKRHPVLSISDPSIALYIVAWPGSNHDRRCGR
jgi:hypothetical protein